MNIRSKIKNKFPILFSLVKRIYHITINYKKNITLRILNLSGQLVYIEVIDAGESTSMKQIDLTALAKGIYHLQVITEDFVFNNKMIIQ
ncbi:MAG: T9SS type A sorting domain-containing protein [Bacteroidetes bacterium]|nr:T9SS type A sorting domain-containing protein [Bacteroidota bacterium]